MEFTFPPFFVDFAYSFDGIQVIDTGSEPNLVHHDYASCLGFSVQLVHLERDVAGGNNVRIAPDCRFDDSGVMCIWNERNDDIVWFTSKEIGVVLGKPNASACDSSANCENT